MYRRQGGWYLIFYNHTRAILLRPTALARRRLRNFDASLPGDDREASIGIPLMMNIRSRD
jgi:hypothetical protein